MAFAKAPSTWLGAGYSLGTNQAIFNTSNHATPCLVECSNTDANATTGDIRQLMFGILEKLYGTWTATAGVDRPTKMIVSRSTSEDQDGNLIRTFIVTMTLNGSTPMTIVTE